MSLCLKYDYACNFNYLACIKTELQELTFLYCSKWSMAESLCNLDLVQTKPNVKLITAFCHTRAYNNMFGPTIISLSFN